MVRFITAGFTDYMMDTERQRNVTLVLGGTGKTGRRVVQRLAAAGSPVRVGSRSGKPPFDWDDPDTWASVLRDVVAVYVAYTPDLAFPGAAATIRAFADLAVAHGVQRLVLLSGRGEEEAAVAERGVQEAGADWTILRSSFFAQNFSEHFLLEPILAGEVAFPADDVAEPFVDAEDIADVAVAALTQDGHAGRIYELTGPRLLTFAAAVKEIAAVVGREIRYLPLASQQYAESLAGFGVPPEEAALITDLFAEVLDGRNAHLTDDVRRVLGREPRDFADYARQAAATGVWQTDLAVAGSAAI